MGQNKDRREALWRIFAEEERLAVLQKELSMRQIVTAVMHLMELHVSEEWSRCRPVKGLAVVTGDSKTVAKFLNQISSVLQKSNGIWLVLLETGSIDEAMKGVVTGLECEMLVAEIREESVIFTEVYVINRNYVHKTDFGSWSPEEGLQLLPLQGFYERRTNLYGVTIKVAAITKFPLSGTKLNENGILVFDNNTFYGQIWKVIEQKLNITTKIVKARDDAIGSISHNGSWSGIIAMLAENEVDVGASDFVMSTTRLGVLEFSEPLYQTSLALFVNPRDVRQVNWNSFLEPFTPRLWFAVLGAILVLTLSVNVFYKIGGDKKDYKFMDLLLYMHGVFCQQGVSECLESVLQRLTEGNASNSLIKLQDLIINKPYPLKQMKKVKTRYVMSIVATLEDNHDVFLPSRFSSLTPEQLNEIPGKFELVYHGIAPSGKFKMTKISFVPVKLWGYNLIICKCLTVLNTFNLIKHATDF